MCQHDCKQGRDCRGRCQQDPSYPAASLTVYLAVCVLAVAGMVLWVIA